MIANAMRPGVLPPEDTPVRFRPTADGRVSVPVDLLRDPKVSRAHIPIALALDHLSFKAEVLADNETIAALCRADTRTVQAALLSLSEAGWIVRLNYKGRGRRRIVLRWKLPDDFADLVPPFGPGRSAPAARAATPPAPKPKLPGQLDLFPDADSARGGG